VHAVAGQRSQRAGAGDLLDVGVVEHEHVGRRARRTLLEDLGDQAGAGDVVDLDVEAGLARARLVERVAQLVVVVPDDERAGVSCAGGREGDEGRRDDHCRRLSCRLHVS